MSAKKVEFFKSKTLEKNPFSNLKNKKRRKWMEYYRSFQTCVHFFETNFPSKVGYAGLIVYYHNQAVVSFV